MFRKNKCGNCRRKISKNYHFCPYCGTELKRHSADDWGMLGTDDFDEDLEEDYNTLFGGINGKVLNSVFRNTLKMLEKEMKEINNTQKIPRTNFKLMINGKEIKFDESNKPIYSEGAKKTIRNEFSDAQLKLFLALSKEEPKTSLKRFGDKIVYEVEMPDVKSSKDIIVNQFENSIEIKAIGKEKSYSKIISVGMPIIGQRLSHGKLILELKES